MTAELPEPVLQAISGCVGQVIGVSVPWEHSSWSAVWALRLENRRSCYVKRSPSTWSEATVMAMLHRAVPSMVPAVIEPLLIDDGVMRWFVIEDAGVCCHDGLDFDIACEAALAMGQLQRVAARDATFAGVVPDLHTRGLMECLAAEHDWARRSAVSGDSQTRLDRAWRLISDRAAALDHADQVLRSLPATAVHADLWRGHITRPPVRFVDWANVVWGAGGVAIANLIGSEPETLHEAGDVWAAFADGWRVHDLDSEYRDACDAAHHVVCLVMDHHVAAFCGQGVDALPGFLATFESLAVTLS